MPDPALAHDQTTEAPPGLLSRICAATAAERATMLSPSFLVSALDGSVEVDVAERPHRAGPFERLCGAIGEAEVEELRAGFVVVVPAAAPGDAASSAWLLSVRNGMLAAAFEFATREQAIAAAPPNSHRICVEKLVERAIWAIVDRDLAELLAIVDEDFTYTDLKRDFTLTGAATAVNHLLLMGYFGVPSIAGLQIRALSSRAVEVTGSVVDPGPFADAGPCGRWRMMVGVEAGRIVWAVHHPDLSTLQ